MRWTALFHGLLVVLVAALGVMIVWRPLPGWLDFWAHAAVGRGTWESGHVADRTLGLWTASEPWVYHSWLSQVIFYGLASTGDPEQAAAVVLGFTLVMALLPFALIALLWGRCGRLSAWAAVPFVLALQGLAVRLQTRPELFTAALLVVLMLLLLRWSRPDSAPRLTRREKLAAVGVLAMFVLWVNLHGAVVLGCLVLAVTAACELVQTRFAVRARVLALLAVLAPVAICINPYGLAYWQTYRPVTDSTFAASILEWRPIWMEPQLPQEMWIALGVLVPLAVAAWALNPLRRWSQLGWLVALGVMFVIARRNVWPFTLTALMVLAANADAINPAALWRRITLWRGRREVPVPAALRWPVRLGVLVWLGLQCVLVIDGLRPWLPLYPAKLEGGIVRFLSENPIEGRVFNDYENSSYLQWRLAGRPPLYIDLLNAYPDRVMRDHKEMTRATERGRVLLDEQQIGVVVLTTNRAGSSSLVPLASYLDEHADWVRVYADGDGVIWVRRSPQYEHLWRPRLGRVNAVAFLSLERWNRDDLVILPPLPPYQSRVGTEPPSTPGGSASPSRK